MVKYHFYVCIYVDNLMIFPYRSDPHLMNPPTKNFTNLPPRLFFIWKISGAHNAQEIRPDWGVIFTTIIPSLTRPAISRGRNLALNGGAELGTLLMQPWFLRGSLYYQPKQCTRSKGNPSKPPYIWIVWVPQMGPISWSLFFSGTSSHLQISVSG